MSVRACAAGFCCADVYQNLDPLGCIQGGLSGALRGVLLEYMKAKGICNLHIRPSFRGRCPYSFISLPMDILSIGKSPWSRSW